MIHVGPVKCRSSIRIVDSSTTHNHPLQYSSIYMTVHDSSRAVARIGMLDVCAIEDQRPVTRHVRF